MKEKPTAHKIYGPETPGYALLNEMQRLKENAGANQRKIKAKAAKSQVHAKPA